MDLSFDVGFEVVIELMNSFYEVLLGIIIGALLGYSARRIMKFAERKSYIDRQSYVAQYVSLAVLSIGKSAVVVHSFSTHHQVYPLFSEATICSLLSHVDQRLHGMDSLTKTPKTPFSPTSLTCCSIVPLLSTLVPSSHSPISTMPLSA